MDFEGFEVSKEVRYEEISNQNNFKKLRILHFNDVYNIENRNIEPCGGSSRFINTLEYLIKNEPALVFFSGDAFSPSNLSMMLKGKQMVEVLNLCHIHAACIGNHEFDFGVETLVNLISNNNFPWLLSNVKDSLTKLPLAGALEKLVIEFNGFKIGVIGIVEEEWMATLSTIDFDEINYESFILAGKRLAIQLKNEENVDLVIALTHMRLDNDEIFVKSVPEIDLFLGGHDHDYEVKFLNNKWLVKSGADFRDLSLIEMTFNSEDSSNKVTKIEHYIIESIIPENLNVKAIVDKYMADLNKELDVILGEVNIDLEGRFAKIRSEETNLGNFICDIVLESVDADCCILNGGSFRSDSLHPKGPFKVRDLKTILPYGDPLVVISVTGKQIHEALENGVSKYPKLEGRFPQISGLRFSFDPSKPSGKRIEPESISVKNEPLDLEKSYRMATKSYLHDGKDGYMVFKNCPILIEDEYIPLLFSLVENHFDTVKKLKKDSRCRLRSSIVPLFIINHLIRKCCNDPTIFKEETKNSEDKTHITFKTAAHIIYKTIKLQRLVISRNDKKIIKRSQKFKKLLNEFEIESMKLEPTVDGRIICLSN